MTTPLTTVLHVYSFDTKTPEGKAGWEAFQAARKADGAPIFGPVLSDEFRRVSALDGQAVTLDPGEGLRNLFTDQWNTAPGASGQHLRIFDWALESEAADGRVGAPRGIKRGHYLEQTTDMQALRRETAVCGYCGAKEPVSKGLAFCPHCIDSEYLTPDLLHMTRMVPVERTDNKRPSLTEAEAFRLLPLYREAQTRASSARSQARAVKKRADVLAKYAKATDERDGFLWLLDHGITAEPIFYSYTGRFCFGWREPLSADVVGELLNVISEFRWPYEIKCDDGRTLSGNIG